MKKILFILFIGVLVFFLWKGNSEAKKEVKTEIVQEYEVKKANDTELNSADTYYNISEKFRAKPNRNTLGINERLLIDFEINEDVDNFVPPKFKGFNVVRGPNQSVSQSWINGKSSYSKTYSYILAPKSQGALKIDEAFIKIEGQKYKTAPLIITVIAPVAEPKNGYSPYDKYFGKGVYNNNSGNIFKIENSNETDAVVLLVNAYSGRKIRNEFVRKGTTFKMTGVPNGTYYLEWFSGTDWWDDLKVGSKFKGGFQTKASFTKTRDKNDWMKVDGNLIWTVTLYRVVGGDVESEKIDASDFFK